MLKYQYQLTYHVQVVKATEVSSVTILGLEHARINIASEFFFPSGGRRIENDSTKNNNCMQEVYMHHSVLCRSRSPHNHQEREQPAGPAARAGSLPQVAILIYSYHSQIDDNLFMVTHVRPCRPATQQRTLRPACASAWLTGSRKVFWSDESWQVWRGGICGSQVLMPGTAGRSKSQTFSEGAVLGAVSVNDGTASIVGWIRVLSASANPSISVGFYQFW